MEFRRLGQHRALKLPQRSLLIMDDEARLAWQHYIPHRKSDVVNSIIIPRAAHRISFTFRQVDYRIPLMLFRAYVLCLCAGNQPPHLGSQSLKISSPAAFNHTTSLLRVYLSFHILSHQYSPAQT